jgi:hypothetical protein
MGPANNGALSTYHEIPRECVNSGFSWRTGGWIHHFQTLFLPEKNRSRFASRVFADHLQSGHPGIPIPCRIRDFIQEVNRSQAPASIPSAISSHSNMEMSPDFLQNCFALRN